MCSYMEKKTDDYWIWFVIAHKIIKLYEIGKKVKDAFYRLGKAT